MRSLFSPVARPLRVHCCTLAVIAALALPGVAIAGASGCGTGVVDPAAATSQRVLDALIATNGVPGMGAAVWQDGEIVWTGCSGLRDVEAALPVRRDTRFRLASVSKVLTATAVAKLAEDGRLDLDAPVAGMLPWLRNDWAPISVRQLAAHVSGLPHYQDADEDRGRMHYPTARAAVGIFADRKLLAAPGAGYAYSSWGYTLMGAVVEAQSGQHFLQYLTKHITRGLDIAADSDGQGADVSRLYVIGDGAPRIPPRHDFSYTWPGGGMMGTPEAVARFGGLLLRGEIVSKATWQAMQRPLLLADGSPAAERGSTLGLGWRMATDADGARIAHHAGVTAGARSALVLWPDQATSVSVLSNALWVASIEQTAMVLAAPFRPTPAKLYAAACPVTAVRYRGTLGKRRFEGKMRFRLDGGRCVGELEAGNSLAEYFDTASAWPGRRLRVIALQADGGLARAALVTPFGLYDLRASTDRAWSARLSGELVLHLDFQADRISRSAVEHLPWLQLRQASRCWTSQWLGMLQNDRAT